MVDATSQVAQMNWLYWLLLAAGIALVVLYVFFPAKLVALSVGLVRKWGRLSVKSATVDDIAWPYLEGGPEDTETIVLVHGFGGDKDNWALYARYLTKQYRVIAPDLPGFGDNVRNPEWRYGAVEQTERLHRFLEQLGLEKFHLGGNSMGGFIALNYALTHPDRLKSLTLIDNAGVTSKNKSELELAVAGGVNPLVATSIGDYDRLMDFITHKRIPMPGFLKRAMFEVHRQNAELLDRIFWTILDEAIQHSLTDRLGEVAVPTLIVWGRHDRLIDISCTEVMAAAIPDNRIAVLDVGHIPMIESPGETARHHIALISDIASRAAGD